jgi:hypothetical protein
MESSDSFLRYAYRLLIETGMAGLIFQGVRIHNRVQESYHDQTTNICCCECSEREMNALYGGMAQTGWAPNRPVKGGANTGIASPNQIHELKYYAVPWLTKIYH